MMWLIFEEEFYEIISKMNEITNNSLPDVAVMC